MTDAGWLGIGLSIWMIGNWYNYRYNLRRAQRNVRTYHYHHRHRHHHHRHRRH